MMCIGNGPKFVQPGQKKVTPELAAKRRQLHRRRLREPQRSLAPAGPHGEADARGPRPAVTGALRKLVFSYRLLSVGNLAKVANISKIICQILEGSFFVALKPILAIGYSFCSIFQVPMCAVASHEHLQTFCVRRGVSECRTHVNLIDLVKRLFIFFSVNLYHSNESLVLVKSRKSPSKFR